MTNAILLTDGYKLDHRRQYPKGTEYVYSNWTPRSNAYFPEAKDGAVVFGVQYFIKKYLIEKFNKDFFDLPEDVAVESFKRRIDTFLGENQVGTEHVRALHKLGYLPIRIKSLPEGSICPIRVPMITVINTLPEFFWLTNFLETIMSCELWLPMTSATTARVYRKELERHAEKTGFSPDVMLGFLCHDFSMRGMAGLEASITSGMGHLTSFVGSETLPAIDAIEDYYNADAEKELIAMTVPASEHSVMCAGGKDDEFETFKRFITEIYPKGFVSIVSDTWDLWQVITDFIPRLKEEILARDGRLVIRPDSGDPIHIICGYTPDDFECFSEQSMIDKVEYKGVYELLWDIFGGTINEKGYKVLDPHIGVIYGDSITLERQKEIYRRLEEKGFAATNLVLGIGSYTYQYRTRDSLGFAMKATWCQVNGESREIFKSPKTDSGMKKSLKGLIRVDKDENGIYYATDCVSKEKEQGGCLETVFEDGKLIKETSFKEIRERLCK
ncbi:nicotinate phosphoribosyltransferase [Clavibacter sp.]|uniref:nicotinate phosphoribosyltransferase n=1 Tax=Clavibacter sp. TaxID=1871044 RepID=UPI00199E236D|nr:nicotinate phosphoribosyltransferase [Clavibacter sp.]MBD5381985.1 nicotinate phosphoribosyltransferase [Clavibacter sp.]